MIIKKVIQEEVPDQTGKKKLVNLAYFTDDKIKPMILNQTNCKIIQGFSKDNSPYINDWVNIPVNIYIDYKIRVGNQITDGLRISPVAPKIQESLPIATEQQIEASIEAISTGKKEKMPVINWYLKNTKITAEQIKQLESL